MALSIDLRERVIAAIDKGMSATYAAKLFKVERKTIYNWTILRKETNSLAPKNGYQNGHSHTIKDWDRFKTFAEANKYRTIEEMSVEWKKATGGTISKSVIQRGLKKINFTYKKKRLITANPIK